MPRPLDLRPMQDFDPSQPAWVYDELNDQVFAWRPEEWLAGWREHATPNDAEGEGEPVTMIEKTPVEMFNHLVALGFVTPSSIEPLGINEPTAYVTTPTILAFSTPPIPAAASQGGKANAKLERRSKRNPKRKRHAGR